jgi:hypothetical protein
VKTAQRRRFSLSYPVGLDVDINKNGLTESLQSVLDLYKTPENIALERFIRGLTEAAGGKDVPAGSRRSLNWEEARRMIDCGMAIGAHTHSHPMQLSFFNSHHDNACYLPMMGFVTFKYEAEQYLCAAVLRPGNVTAGARAVGIVRRLMALIRNSFPKVRIRIRLDGGLANPELLAFMTLSSFSIFVFFVTLHEAFLTRKRL